MATRATLAPPQLVGLSLEDAMQRLRAEGPNELPAGRPQSWWSLACHVIREPMFLLLLCCGAVYLLLGEPGEAAMLVGFVFVVMALTFYQHQKTERALEALRDLSSPRALVIRGGAHVRIAGRDVVRDDLLILAEGDRVPADGVLLWCNTFSADESLITGESVPVGKTVWDGKQQLTRPGGDDLPFVFSGTLVTQGQGIAKVLRTGAGTEMGKIGKALTGVQVDGTLLQKEVGFFVKALAAVGISLGLIVVAILGLVHDDWLHGILTGITVAMALLPEELPVVLTIFLALGAWRLSKIEVLTRSVPAVETLGAATVLCVDKTGTLTMNQMTIRKLIADRTTWSSDESSRTTFPEEVHELVEFGILASQRDPFDPMEKAFHELGNNRLSNTEHLHADWNLVREYPLSPELLALSHVWKSPGGQEFIIASKGAPEAIIDLCHLAADRTTELTGQVSAMAAEGLRVLGVARGVFRQRTLPGHQHDFEFEFLGLVGLADPLRPTAAAAIAECHSAGVRVVMITGDHPVTARSIAQQIGLTPADKIVTGSELDAMDDAVVGERIRSVSIFARMVPEQKLRLVKALKANGDIVAMTGDGVNDAPALKAAHIGIAMGRRGTDVAREAASFVLLDDDFSSIVHAVRMGRRIYGHIRKAMTYVLACHVPIAGMSLIPVIFNLPLVLLPVHILFLQLIIDPACSIVFEAEPEEADIMRRLPRKSDERLFSPRTLAISMLQGGVILLLALAIFVIALYRGQGEDDARTLCFTTMIVANLSLIFVNRSWSRSLLASLRTPNRPLWWVTSGTLFFLGLVLYTPFLRELFHFSTLHTNDLVLCFSVGILGVIWFEGVKAWQSRFVSQ